MLLQPPITEAVYWNPDEKIIGVVGVAPAATADFYHKLIRLTPVKKDWEHVRVIIDPNPKIPSRGRYFELSETDPVPFIRQSIQQLQEIGANIIALPCNTAHILYDRYAENSFVLIPNMIMATRDSTIRRCGKTLKTVAVFTSKLTQQHGLYEKAFKNQHIEVLDTSLHQVDISELIEQVKQGQATGLLTEKMNGLFSAYTQANAFIIGCTELSLLVQDHFAGIPIIDSNIALAETCLTLAQNNAFIQSKPR